MATRQPRSNWREPTADNWRRFAYCASPRIDMGIFFPVSTAPTANTPALAICSLCPVRQLCLTACLAVEESSPTAVYGIFGGKTPEERKLMISSRIRRRQREAAARRKEAERKAAERQRATVLDAL